MTIRLDDNQAAELELVARVDNMPVAEAVREAISVYISVRRSDSSWIPQLRHLMEADREVAKRLERGES